ncbi:GvpL/GvpF family gas vesicle protein [Actinopolymorpha pittospori]|uniref:Gas vesicle synthesis protein GvpL/GvpF n=1 Tax=Actinopolymorpha pittospori TaxID=648752 RepID=A0A927MVS6_9ACTN|nr:GvpL/GvpF family gas vesicle protein [Actinopolymorpha pittospori]MBE1607154.1 hypothetical protein [Actinopolymorpha pittospori]
MNQHSQQGTYLYAIVRAASVEVAGLKGVADSGAVRLVSHRQLAVAVGDVSLSVLDIPEEELSEDGRLAELATTHDAVVRALFAQGPALPLRLATVVSNDEAAIRVLEELYDEATQRLCELEGRREWGVRLRRDSTQARTASTEGDGARPTGTAYLQRRRQALRAAEDARQQERDISEDVFARLGTLASEMGRQPGTSAEVILNAAYLVATAAEDAFLAAVELQAEALASQGVRLELTGPWPPYSFAQMSSPAVTDA